MNLFPYLGHDISSYIVSLLDYKSLLNCSFVCKAWKVTITPNEKYFYGRCHQLLIDHLEDGLYFENSKDRRYRIREYIKRIYYTIYRLLHKAIEIAEDKKHQLSFPKGKKPRIDNGRFDLFFKPLNTNTNGDEFWRGRYVQFLLDTDVKKFNLGTLENKDYLLLNLQAEQIKEEILARSLGVIIIQCDPYDGSSMCSWRYGMNRCRCGNTKITWSGYYSDIDAVQPDGNWCYDYRRL